MVSVVNFRLFGNVAVVDAGDIHLDPNFEKLASSKTSTATFMKLVSEHLPGHTQKKRLWEALKELLTKVDAAEQKLYMVKNVGRKAGAMESEEHILIDKYSSNDIKDKRKALNAEINAMIEEGRITDVEKPLLQQQLAEKRSNAKEENKANIVEKAEQQLVCLGKAETISHPVAQLESFFPLEQELTAILRLEKLPEKKLSDEDRASVAKKGEIQETLKDMGKKHRMWFETDAEFHRRLEKALYELAKQKEEQKKREAEEAAERKRLAEEEAMEKKRQAIREAEERKAKELEEKLEAKRQEAALKPKKEVAPCPKKKEKAKATKVDTQALGFHTEIDEYVENMVDEDTEWYKEAVRDLYRQYDTANLGKVDALLEKFKGMESELYKIAWDKYEKVAEQKAKEEAAAAAKASSAAATATKAKSAEATKVAEPVTPPEQQEPQAVPPDTPPQAPVKKAAPAKPATPAPWLAAEVHQDDEDEEDEAAGPSLADALTAPKKKAAPHPNLLLSQSKGKQKSKGTKLDMNELGFHTEIDTMGDRWAAEEAKAAEDEATKYKVLVRELYEEHDPSMLSKVDAMLEKYKGMEPELYKIVLDKFESKLKEKKSSSSASADAKAAPAPASSSKAAAEPASSSSASAKAPAKKPAPKEPIPSKWSAPVAPVAAPEAAAAVEEDAAEAEEAVDLAGPSLAEAAAPGKKGPPPKKAPKKKFTKMSVSALGFDANNPNYA